MEETSDTVSSIQSLFEVEVWLTLLMIITIKSVAKQCELIIVFIYQH